LTPDMVSCMVTSDRETVKEGPMIVVGTAGHIDHGKTTLIQRLTGIETDRLKEEKQRGISIELGFAYLDLPDGQRVGLIDVPGHERFVHHMIAGATGVDLVILVVAADEGVMPQTREHVSICGLLGMRRGIVVVTKTDLVDPEWLELVREDVADYVGTTFLAGAPILEFSAAWEGDRLDAFKAQLYEAVQNLTRALEKSAIQRPFMMPVDRVFTIRGFGTVVTGTVQSGRIQTGQTVRVLPGGRNTKVRRIENHGETAEESRAGTRTAVNLADVQRDDVQRGNVIVDSDVFEPVVQLTGVLRAVAGLQVELKPQFKALFHTGSAFSEASVRLLSGTALGPSEETMVGIRLTTPLAILPGDHFVLRGFSMVADYGRTLGGGTILWPGSVKARPENLEALHRLRGEDPRETLSGLTRLAGLEGIDAASLGYLSPLSREKLLQAAEALDGDALRRLAVGGRTRLVHPDIYEEYARRLEALLQTYHDENPRRRGMPREELKTRMPPYFDRELILAIVERMLAEGRLQGDERIAWLPTFEVCLDDLFVRRLEQLKRELAAGGLGPPTRDALRESLGLDDRELAELLQNLVEQGAAVKVSSDFYYDSRQVDRARDQLVDFLRRQGTVTTQELKDLWGLTRKHLIPLAEYFDATRVTARISTSERKLRGQ
jgi:selenocysteine-specific elongation factor